MGEIMSNRHHVAIGLLSGVSMLAMASQAFAQGGGQAGVVEEVVVTGSRVIQNGNNSPTPLTVVTADQLAQTNPSTVIDGLISLPVFAGGRTPTTQPGNSSQNNASRTLNLRNVGATRTLVLFDGRRVAPTSPLGEVNADFVPSMLLQRVDVVTGGASAVYGSDAVAGVVNFITDRNFNGYKIDAHYGRSERGDGDEYKLGIAGGMPLFGGRGHIEGSYEYFNSPGIFSKLGRKWGQAVYSVQGAGTTANPYHLIRDTRISSTSFGGFITAANPATNPLRDMTFRQNGILDKFQHGTPSGNTGIESGGDGGYYSTASLQSLYQSDLAFARFDYDVTDSVHFYSEVTGMLSHNMNNHQHNEFRNITLSSQNAFLDPAYRAQMAAAGVNTFTFSKIMRQAPTLQPETYNRGYMANFGLNGDIAGYRWDVSYSHTYNQQRTRNNANIDLQRAYASLDAVRAPDGRVVCNVTLTNPGLYPGCVPLNLFGPTSESAEALDYILAVTRYVATTKMDNIGGSIAGSPFSSWAGPVQVALSGEWRKLTFDQTSTALPIPADCTGLRFSCTRSTLKYISNVLAEAHDVSQSVKEVAGEVSVPLLSGVRFADALNLTGAVRFTDYDTSGKVTTWKAGLDWHVNDSLTFRGTRSRDIRAPNLNELFAPRLINPSNPADRHTGLSGQAPVITDPNPDLEPEVAETWTAGVVFRPEFLPRFSLAVDWYKISIANAISVLSGTNTTIQNLCEAANGVSEFCDLIERPLPFSDRSAANYPSAFYQRPQNAQTLKTNGIDFEANYAQPLFDGNLSLRGLVSYQPKLETVQFPGAPIQDSADTPALPEWRVTAFVKYTYNNFSVDVQERWHNKTGWTADRTLIFSDPRLPAVAYTNINFSYNWEGKQAYFAIQNLFDKQPTPYGPTASGVPGLFGGYINGEDTIGRYFTVGFRMKR
jgi:iron complex outermembrane receptor protein